VAEVKEVTTISNKGLKGFVEDTFLAGHFIDNFVKEVAQVGNAGPRFLDWSSRYISRFNGCTDFVDYVYADHKLTYGEEIPTSFTPCRKISGATLLWA
jgi:hypothetical protein